MFHHCCIKLVDSDFFGQAFNLLKAKETSLQTTVDIVFKYHVESMKTESRKCCIMKYNRLLKGAFENKHVRITMNIIAQKRQILL